jgi:hypothetical protein
VTDLADLRIPVALRPAAAQVITLTDRVCADLLDEEYAALARHVIAKLARKRPSPLLTGRAATWVGGVLWALGQVNFLFDRAVRRPGRPYDARELPTELQVEAYRQGVIPLYVPALGCDGTAAAEAALRS